MVCDGSPNGGRPPRPYPRLAVGLELAAQIADVDIERVRLRSEVVAPDLVEDHVAAEDLALVGDEQLEELVLRARELDLAVPAATRHRVAIDDEIAEAQLAA